MWNRSISLHSFLQENFLFRKSIINNGSYLWSWVCLFGLLELNCANRDLVRVSLPLVFPTRELLLLGARLLPKKLRLLSAVWLRRVFPPLKLVLCWEIRRVLVRLRLWPALRFSDSLRRTVRFRLSVSWLCRSCSLSSWGYVLPHQEGCRHQKASWA